MGGNHMAKNGYMLCITEARRHHARVQRVGLPLPAPGALAARAGGSEGSTPGRSRQVMAVGSWRW